MTLVPNIIEIKDNFENYVSQFNETIYEYINKTKISKNLEENIENIRFLRENIYENLNQILHEYYLYKLMIYLKGLNKIAIDDKLYWNPRQTGKADEPDFKIIGNNKIINCELTTSKEAVGIINKRMKNVLLKLNTIKGENYYAVINESMKKNAEKKVSKLGLNINVILLK